MAYKHARKPLPEIARELSVDAVVEGTVLRSGEQVRITAQLIQAPADKHLWAESYEGNLRDTLGPSRTFGGVHENVFAIPLRRKRRRQRKRRVQK